MFNQQTGSLSLFVENKISHFPAMSVFIYILSRSIGFYVALIGIFRFEHVNHGDIRSSF